jgi:hypothetical protein
MCFEHTEKYMYVLCFGLHKDFLKPGISSTHPPINPPHPSLLVTKDFKSQSLTPVGVCYVTT